jgi:dolichol-phosphate mannosyltransferase
MSNSLKLLIVIPTLNEGGNIKRLFLKIKNNVRYFDLLFIDDNSSDDTLREINFLKKKNKNIFLIKRPLKLGIGSAHKEGIKFAFKKKYKILVTMDADGTHDPKFIKYMLKKINSCSLVITNRFLNKDSLKGWSFFRRALTYLRYVVINFLFSINYDTSGAFRIYDLN